MNSKKARFASSARLSLPLSLIALSLAGAVHADPYDPAHPEARATGDWGGLRNELFNDGFDFSLEYVGEAATVMSGGYDKDKTARYADQFALGMDVDLQKVLGWHDAEFKLAVTERSGRNITNDRIGDPRVGTLSSSQEVYGRGQTYRLTQMWYKQKFLDGALDIKFGRFGEGEDFNSFPCDFQNLSFCGSQVGNYVNTWYNWPVSQWAARIKYNITPEFYAQIGAYAYNPSNLETGNGFELNTSSGNKGAVLPVEVVWSPKVNGLPGEYRLGYYKSTANASDVYKDVNGNPQGQTGLAAKSDGSKHGWWVVAQQQLTSVGGDTSRGLSVFSNVTVHDKATNVVDNYQQVGLVYKGLMDSRPKDDIGVGIARIHVNDDVRRREEQINSENGITDYDDPSFVPVQHSEYNAEIYYGVHVTDWLTVRPNLQYTKHPGGVDEVQNAFVAGLKIQSVF